MTSCRADIQFWYFWALLSPPKKRIHLSTYDCMCKVRKMVAQLSSQLKLSHILKIENDWRELMGEVSSRTALRASSWLLNALHLDVHTLGYKSSYSLKPEQGNHFYLCYESTDYELIHSIQTQQVHLLHGVGSLNKFPPSINSGSHFSHKSSLPYRIL